MQILSREEPKIFAPMQDKSGATHYYVVER